MRFRGLLIAAVLLGALAGGVWWSKKAEKEGGDKASSTESPKILSIPEDQFQQVEIRKASGDSIVLKKGKDDKWEMTAPQPLPVDQESMRSMVSTLSSLNSDRVVEEKAPDLGAFGLTKPGLDVTVTRKDGKSTRLLIGDETPTSGSYFAKLADDPRVFTMASWNKTSIDKTPSDLRDKRLLRFESEKLVRVELSAKGETIEFGKNSQNEWQIIRPRPLRADGLEVGELVRKLGDAKMDLSSDAGEKKTASGFATAQVVATAKVTDPAGTQTIEVRKGKDNNYYAKSSAVEGIFKVASDLGTGVDKKLDDFRTKKLLDFGWNDPSKVEVRDGDKKAEYSKSGDQWTSAGKRMESADVQALIDKLRDLSSVKFLEGVLANPVFEAAVTSSEGKRVEKVLIARQGEKYVAKRENEPPLYELDAQAFLDLQKAAASIKPYQAPKDEKKK